MLDLVSLDYFEVSDGPEQLRRNITINTSGSSSLELRDIRDGVRDQGHRYFDAPEAKGVFRRLAQFDAEGYDPGIVLGNDSSGRRYLRGGDSIYRFVAVFEQENPNLRSPTRKQMIISGYTDRAELDGDVPSMDTVMHINSILSLNIREREGRGGKLTEEYSVISNGLMILPDRHQRNAERLSTPVTFADYVDDLGDGNEPDISIGVVGEDGNTSRVVRHNLSLPNNYFRSLALADMKGKEDKQATYGGMSHDSSRTSFISSRLNSTGNESVVAENDFVRAIKSENIEGYEDIRRENAFTLGDLIDMTCETERDGLDLIEVFHFDNSDYDAANWGSGRQVTLDVYDLCHRIPEHMLNNLIRGCAFRCSNLHSSRHTGRVEPEFQFFEDVNDRDEDSYSIESLTASGDIPEFFLDRFEDLFIEDIFIPLTRNGDIPVEVSVWSTLSGMTKVEIDYDDEGEVVDYVFKSFVESRLSTHLVSTKNRRFADSVREYHTLREEIDTGVILRASRDHDAGWDDDTPRKETKSIQEILGSRPSLGRQLLNSRD